MEKEQTAQVKRAMLCMTRQCWEQGICAQALLETGDLKRLTLAAHDMVLRQGADGRLCDIENTPAVTDSSFCVPAVLAAARMEKNEAYEKAAERNIMYLLRQAPKSADGILYHMRGTCEIWADSAAFTPYALSLLGYHREAFEQMLGITRKLYVPEKKLYNHIWDEGKKTFQRPEAWGVGNGWILTGLLRLIISSGQGCAEEKRILTGMFRELLDSMLSFLTPDGKFHYILDDPDTFPETETCAMTAYAIFRACKENLIGRSFLEQGRLLRDAVWSMVDADGLVQGCAASPDFLHPGTSVEGQAHTLMMEKAYRETEALSECGKRP